MKTIKESIDQSVALAQKLMAETPFITSIGFEITDLTIDEMKEASKVFDTTEPEFRVSIQRFTSVYSPVSGVYIHLRSVKLKGHVVYEPETV